VRGEEERKREREKGEKSGREKLRVIEAVVWDWICYRIQSWETDWK
jgi:hypothetical protein